MPVHRPLRRLLLAYLLSCALPAAAQLPRLEVSVRRAEFDKQTVYEVGASGLVRASPAAVWKILTDYERMPEFVPDLQSAKVVSRSGNRVLLEQQGVASFLFFRRAIRLVVQITEEPTTSISISLVDGDMKVYACHWEIQALADGGTRIVYSGKLVPKFYVPSMLGTNLIRADIEKMMLAVLDRIDRPG